MLIFFFVLVFLFNFKRDCNVACLLFVLFNILLFFSDLIIVVGGRISFRLIHHVYDVYT